jgi:hypothetical protein
MNTYENRMDAWLSGPFFEIQMPTQNPFYHGKLVILMISLILVNKMIINSMYQKQ